MLTRVGTITPATGQDSYRYTFDYHVKTIVSHPNTITIYFVALTHKDGRKTRLASATALFKCPNFLKNVVLILQKIYNYI